MPPGLETITGLTFKVHPSLARGATAGFLKPTDVPPGVLPCDMRLMLAPTFSFEFAALRSGTSSGIMKLTFWLCVGLIETPLRAPTVLAPPREDPPETLVTPDTHDSMPGVSV